MDLAFTLSKFAGNPLSTHVLLGLLKDYNRPYDKIMELVRQGYLIQMKRGLYITSTQIGQNTPEPLLIANHMYGPSYVSLDTALFYWGLIPERVFELTSVTSKISKQFNALGRVYSFTHLPLPYYAFGIQQISITEKQTVLMAGPEKSLCDKIITTSGIQLRSKQQSRAFLLEDLRLDEELMKKLDVAEIESWLPDCPKRNSIKVLIETLKAL